MKIKLTGIYVEDPIKAHFFYTEVKIIKSFFTSIVVNNLSNDT